MSRQAPRATRKSYCSKWRWLIIQGVVPLLVIVIVIAAVGAWVRRRGRAKGAEDWREAPALLPPDTARKQGMAAPRRGTAPVGFGGLGGDLNRWVGAGLIDAGQADAIAAFERALLGGAGATGKERRVSLLAEALGYVGVVLALAGLAVGLGQSWDELPTWAHVAIPVVTTALLVLGGWLLRTQEEPAFDRLMGVLWMLSVGTTAWALAVVGAETADLTDERVALMVGIGCSALAMALWLARRSGFQQAALLASLHVLVVAGLLLIGSDSPPSWWFAAAVWAIGASWAWLGWRNLMAPPWLAVALGCLGAVIGPSVGLGDHEWLLAPALLTTAAVMAASIPSRETPLLALGTIGSFGYITYAVVHYFKDNLGVPMAMVIVGAVFLALAVLAGNLTARVAGRESPTRGPSG